MGVLSCSRRGCPNVMCARHSFKYGYICDECFEELVASNTQDISLFMGIHKDDYNEYRIDREFYEEEFMSR